MEDKMEDKIVLICATGRSGSTTMQRIINTIPNSNMCGENAGAINHLLAFYNKIKYTTFMQVPGNVTPFAYDYLVKQKIKPSWYNSYNLYELREKVRDMILTMLKPNETINLWGFKEIRYDGGSIQYIKDFKDLFPQTKVILHIREDLQKQSKSGWFKKDKNALPFLLKNTKELIDFYKENQSYCYISTFEKMFVQENLKNIFKFIDCSEHYNEVKIKEVLNNNIKD